MYTGELEAKEKAARTKWQRRVEATLAAAAEAEKKGEEYWIPRVEELARRRGLTELEKLILLTLVGVVISEEIKQVHTHCIVL